MQIIIIILHVDWSECITSVYMGTLIRTQDLRERLQVEKI